MKGLYKTLAANRKTFMRFKDQYGRSNLFLEQFKRKNNKNSRDIFRDTANTFNFYRPMT